ncbi:YceD family protein [Zongyangia hominis]|uniref:DUF177 domain-containing protein n=1 Tax=Zongyangia hominis TaxID=2763677 RepID=A0A926EBV1_9FIRM|nr:DUF177 domain-containing protein [Zongyangia hominis]MBC8570943.1 DUF177 domain-containing protein [Zongyangia hominis]
MLIDVKQLFDVEGEARRVDYELDLSGMELGTMCPLSKPVAIRGEICNRAGVVTLRYTASFVYEGVCDRCLEPVIRPFAMDFEHTLVTRLEGEDQDEFLVIEDGKLEMDELVRSDILLEFPTKILCGEDCKGLCPVCGTNRNIRDCGCRKPQPDPRLAALKELLD